MQEGAYDFSFGHCVPDRQLLVCLVCPSSRIQNDNGLPHTIVLGNEKGMDSRDYGSLSYWEDRYGNKNCNEEEQTDEWCYDYEQMAPLLEDIRNLLDSKDTLIVDLGCGVSELVFDLRNDAWESNILGLDYSMNAVDLMRRKSEEKKSKRIKFEQCDILNLDKQLQTESVDLFIDKMTLDTILHLPGDEGPQNVSVVLAHVANCLKFGGHFVLVSQMSIEADTEFFSSVVVDAFRSVEANWKIDEHISEESPLHVFVFSKRPKHNMRLRQASNAIEIKTHCH